MMDKGDAMLQASTDAYIEALQGRWDEFSARLEADLLRIHTEIFQTGDVSYATFVQAQGDFKVASAIRSELIRLHGDIIDGQYEALVAQYKDAYNVTSWALDEATPFNVDVKYAIAPENQIRQFVSGEWKGDMFATRNEKEMYFLSQDLQKEVTLAMLQGQSASELSKTIQGVIGTENSDYKYRAERIARTELLRAANMSRKHVFDQNKDIIEVEVWVTRALADGRLCPECRERAGKTREEVVLIAAEQDLDEDPPAHPNCGCTWMPKLKSIKDLLPEELSKGIEDFAGPDELVNPIMKDGDLVFTKAKPDSFDSWSDKYLSDAERGNL